MLFGTTAVLCGYALLYSVVPLWLVRNGTSEFIAGSSTGLFMASTVLSQLGVPALVRALGYRVVNALGAILLGVPAVFLTFSTGWQAVFAISLVRGVGFGCVTVCGSAMIAELLPRSMHARGSGLYGLAVGIPQLVGLPVGTFLAQQWGFTPVFFAAAVLPLLGLVPIGLLSRGVSRASVSASGNSATRSAPSTAELTWRPWLTMLSVSIGFGALATFLPIMFTESPGAGSLSLLVVSGTALFARWIAGIAGDRVGSAGRMLPLALLTAGVGLAAVSMATSLSPVAAAVLVVGAVSAFGIGFGVVQNDSLVLMFGRVSASRASVVWNIAFDAGQGAGALIVGAVVSAVNFTVAFGVLAGAALALVPVAVRARTVG